MRDYLLVTDLVARAGKRREAGVGCAGGALLPANLVDLPQAPAGDADARAVGQSIWRQLVRQLDKVQDPGALAGWLAAAAWRECGNVRFATEGPQIAGKSPTPGVNPAIRSR